MKKVLIVSPHFPPLNAPDMQRVRLSLPYFANEGWEPVVLALDDAWQQGVREPELLATIPSHIRIVRTRGLPHWVYRALGLRNAGLRAWPFFLLHGAWLLATEKFDLVYFSTTQFVTFPLGRLWRRGFGVPYVIDVQDPWRTDYYERPGAPPPPGGWKYQFARAQAWALEGWSFRRAAGVIAVSPSYLADLRRRYAAMASIPTEVIGFGASRTDLTHALAHDGRKPTLHREPGEVHLVYTGVAGAVMHEALTALFSGLRSYRQRHPDRARRLRFHFIGTSYAPAGEAVESVRPLAAVAGVDDQVAEHPQRIGHLEALRWQAAADGLILLGSGDPAYSPSKLYPYLLTGRPILALFTAGSVGAQLIDELRCAFLVTISTDASNVVSADRLIQFFDLALTNFPAGSMPAPRTAELESRFLADALTARQCALFSRALSPQPAVI